MKYRHSPIIDHVLEKHYEQTKVLSIEICIACNMQQKCEIRCVCSTSMWEKEIGLQSAVKSCFNTWEDIHVSPDESCTMYSRVIVVFML